MSCAKSTLLVFFVSLSFSACLGTGDPDTRPSPFPEGDQDPDADGDNPTTDDSETLCGNSICDEIESCGDCPTDCGACPTSCEPGWMLHNQACVPDRPLVFAERSAEEMCTQFQNEMVAVSPEWEATPESDDECDPGTMPSRSGHSSPLGFFGLIGHRVARGVYFYFDLA